MEKRQNYFIWTEAALQPKNKTENMYVDTAKDIKKGLIIQIMNQKDH